MPKPPGRPTVTVSDRGEITAGTPRVSYRQGFADLLDFTSPPARIAVLPPGAPTAIGLRRTGHAIRDALAAFGNTYLTGRAPPGPSDQPPQ